MLPTIYRFVHVCIQYHVIPSSGNAHFRKVNNVIEAAYQGANQSIKLVANICINLMAFLAILKFLNNTLTWFGERAGVDDLTFEVNVLDTFLLIGMVWCFCTRKKNVNEKYYSSVHVWTKFFASMFMSIK